MAAVDYFWLRNWPQDFRKFMAWLFAIACVGNSVAFSRSLPVALTHHYSLSFIQRLLYAPIFPAIVAIICGTAWWTGWKEKRSARGWGIAASVMYLVIFIRQFLIPLQPVTGRHVGALLFGIVGIYVFLRNSAHPFPNSLIEAFYERDAPQDIFKKR